MKINIDIDVSTCQLDTEQMLKLVGKELEKCAYKIERTSKEYVPEKYEESSGDLRRSINTKPVSLLEYQVGTNVDYALYIEEGTTPHIINGNPLLHWQRNGTDYYATQVYHTGNRPYLYMERAMFTHTEDLEERIAKAIKL
jgi:hypothetical protein